MIPSKAILLGLAAVANAVPFMTERDLNSTVWTPEHVLKQDEVILYGSGRSKSHSVPSPSLKPPTNIICSGSRSCQRLREAS